MVLLTGRDFWARALRSELFRATLLWACFIGLVSIPSYVEPDSVRLMKGGLVFGIVALSGLLAGLLQAAWTAVGPRVAITHPFVRLTAGAGFVLGVLLFFFLPASALSLKYWLRFPSTTFLPMILHSGGFFLASAVVWLRRRLRAPAA